MAATVLNSHRAVQTSIAIVRVFSALRKMVLAQALWNREINRDIRVVAWIDILGFSSGGDADRGKDL